MENIISNKNKKLNIKSSKKQIMKTTIKRPVGFEKNLQELLKSNGISIEILKYKNFRITKTPNKNFPEMVTITRCVSGLKPLLGKSFINLEKVKSFIDSQMSLKMIERGKKSIQGELLSIGLGDLNS